ncbi:hypothetical protein PENTCL1PPCAC_29811, partial [Pristionchus entomophagus]
FGCNEHYMKRGNVCKEQDFPTSLGCSCSGITDYTDCHMEYFNRWENINARITLPLTFNTTEPRNRLTKIVKYKEFLNFPFQITILPECLSKLVDVMASRFQGNIDLVNPDTLSTYEFASLYKELLHPSIQNARELLTQQTTNYRIDTID